MNSRTKIVLLVAALLPVVCCCGPAIIVNLFAPRRGDNKPPPKAVVAMPPPAPAPAPSAPELELQTPPLIMPPVMVQIRIYDDTKTNPIHNRAAISFRGNDLWWFKVPASTAREKFIAAGAKKTLGLRMTGKKYDGQNAILLYADGYEIGPTISIPFTMPLGASPSGSDRDSIVIEISDEEVEIMGPPIQATTGHVAMLLKRRTGELLATTDAPKRAKVEAEIARIELQAHMAQTYGKLTEKIPAVRDAGNNKNKNGAWVFAQEFVKRSLKSPSTARFGSTFGEYQNYEDCVTGLGDGEYLVKGWVDSQNSFGATVRSNFVLTVKDNGKSWSLIGGPVIVTRQ